MRCSLSYMLALPTPHQNPLPLERCRSLSTLGPWQDAGDITVATAEWVSWYNNESLHSACGNIPPAEYENDWIMGNGQAITISEAQAS
jgi:hypothetical protein